MVFIIIGVVLGIVLGAAVLGFHGWIIGSLLGGLAGLVFQQLKKINLLELSIKNLADEQVKTNRQLALLKSDMLQTPRSHDQTQPPPAIVTQPVSESPPVIPAAAKTTPAPVLATVPELSTAVLEQSVYPVRPSAAPEKSAVAGLEDKISLALRRFFSEGNPIVRIGMVVMFFGVSFLVKYAAGQGFFPIEFRLSCVLLGAIALLGFGWKTRARARAYGLVLQGGGIAIIYLTLFAAAKIYGLIPLGGAFGLLFLVVILGALLALLQNAQVLAILASAGGFVAPILTSTGEGSHVGLFSFYLILNIGILIIAVYKSWRMLNWVGFMFTFVITAAWGVLKYDPALYASTQPFLVAFFALYLLVSILFSFKQPTNLKGMVDGSLVFGLPLIAFGLQTALLKHTEYGLAISAVALAVIYLSLSAGLARRYLQSHRVLIESFLALGICFATLAVPLALAASWTSVTWALEATGLVWVGLRQQRLRPRFVGYLLHIAAAISLVIVGGLNTGAVPIISGDYVALLLLALTSLTIAYLLQYFHGVVTKIEMLIAAMAIACGVLWFFVAGIREILAHIQTEQQFASIIIFASVSALALLLVSQKTAWPNLAKSVYALLPFVVVLSLLAFIGDRAEIHPAKGFGLLAILAFLAIQYRFLFKQELALNNSLHSHSGDLLSSWHIFTAWLVFALIFWEVSWQKNNLNLQGSASLMIWFAAVVIPAILLIGAGQKKCWPFITFAQDYKNSIPAPLFALLAIWFFAVCHKTIAVTEYYLPLLNVLDLAQFAIILVFAYAIKREFMDRVKFFSTNARAGLLGIMLFVWVNVVCLRAMSHYQDISYSFASLWGSVQVQMALSILWAMCALLVMNLSRRSQRRELWMVGAGLLGCVVLKLFTKDLTGSGTLARIVSFLVVGGLMLLIGFISPIPAKPKIKEKTHGALVGGTDSQSPGQ